MKKLSKLIIVFSLVLFWACKKKQSSPIYSSGKEDSVIINTTNTNISNNLDSVGFIKNISQQKLQAVYDMASLKKRNPGLSKEIEQPIMDYFFPEDSSSIKKIYTTLDSLRAYYVEVHNIQILEKESEDPKSVGKISYSVNYFNKDKSYIKGDEKIVEYILEKQPEKLKNQFTFYLYNLEEKQLNKSGETQ